MTPVPLLGRLFVGRGEKKTVPMRGLSITQPWASLVALGAKTIETRSWSTNYRGVVFIQAAKGFPTDCQHLCHRAPFQGALLEGGVRNIDRLPRGSIVAVAQLVTVVTADEIFLSPEVAAREYAFGDFAAGRFAWVLQSVRPLTEPVPCKGALGLWAVPADVRALVAAQGVL